MKIREDIILGDINKFFLNKILFPKVLIIDSPGIIISKTTRKYGKPATQKRLVYLFEDILVNFQLEMVKIIGSDKSYDFFYKIGKDVGYYYLLMAHAKKHSKIFLRSVLNYIFESLRSVGYSLSEKTSFNFEKNEFYFYAKNNIILRKTGEAGLFAGFISGILTYLLDKNIETKLLSCSEDFKECEFLANLSFVDKYIIDPDKLSILMKDYSLNFPKIIKKQKGSSLKDFIRFKKIKITRAGKHIFCNKTILLSEIGFVSIFVKNSIDGGFGEVLYNSVVAGSESLAKNLFLNLSKSDSILFLKSFLSSFGWGNFEIFLKSNNIEVNIKNPPYDVFCLYYLSLVLLGFFNEIFNEKYEIVSKKLSKKPVLFKIVYQKILV